MALLLVKTNGMRRISSTLLASTFLLLFVNVCSAGTHLIKSVREYNLLLNTIRPGDTVIWVVGTYSDIKWVIDSDGINVLAQKPGSVIFNGSSSVTIHANNVTFSGFQFIDGAVNGNVAEVSGSNNRISDINIDNYASRYYFHVTPKGRHNVVERCNFENKPQALPGKEGSSIFQVAVDSLNPGYNVIRYCSFKNHTAPLNSGGDYGMEALRIGYSYQCKFISRTIVEYCYFTKCNGDGEIISNKARQNIIRYNTFSDNGESHLTLRHGGENVVYGNFFIGGAGIRIKEGQTQMVYNNYFSTGSYFSIRLENYRVDPLKNIVIAHNTFFNSGPIRFGGKGDFKPAEVQVADNLFVNPVGQVVDDLTGTEQFSGNGIVLGKLPSISGFHPVKMNTDPNESGFFQPGKFKGKRSVNLAVFDIPVLSDDPGVRLDIAGNKRPVGLKASGCYEPSGKSAAVEAYATSANTGPPYLKTPGMTGSASVKHRLIVLADMGNERDEEQQMIHLLMYANEFDVEGLIAVSGIFLNSGYRNTNPYKSILHPGLFDTLVAGYSKVYENLKKHADGWPTPEYLHSIIISGQKDYGMDDTGPGKSSPGLDLIIRAVGRKDPRPVYVVVNAGSNTLAQAIFDYKKNHSPEQTDAFIRKLIVFENGSQDDAGAWIVSNFPKIHWIRSNYQTYAYAGPGLKISPDTGPYVWHPYPETFEGQHQWAKENIQNGHGALGELYPDRILRNQFEFLEGGGTIPWLGLITSGLSDPMHPGWGGWSGRFTSVKKDTVWSRHQRIADREKTYPVFSVFADTSDRWINPADRKTYDDIFTPVHRWRQDQFNDFKARMDWCLLPFGKANHNPVAVINGLKEEKIMFMTASPGQKIRFDASKSYDPDKNQKLSFSWWIYREAGNYIGECRIEGENRSRAELKIPDDARGKQIHLILDVFDNSPVAVMHDYRRIVLNVK